MSGSTATYRSVLPDTDLRLSAVASGLEESLVLRSAKASSTWTFPLRLSGLTPHLAADGSIELRSPSGTTVARIPPGFMQDSRMVRVHGRLPMPVRSMAVTYQLVTVGGQPAIKMTASKAWLDDPARVYPVTVDPNFTASGTTYVMYPDTMDDSVYDDLLVGTWDNGGQIGNSFLAFANLGSALAGEHISSPSLNIFDMEAATCRALPAPTPALIRALAPG